MEVKRQINIGDVRRGGYRKGSVEHEQAEQEATINDEAERADESDDLS